MATSSQVTEPIGIGSDYPLVNKELDYWFFVPDNEVRTDPFETDLRRVSLFYANDYGSLAPEPIQSVEYAPPVSKDDVSKSFKDYLRSFTIPYYGDMWKAEISKAEEGSIPSEPIIPDDHRTVPFGDKYLSMTNRNKHNQRKRMFWNIKVWMWSPVEDKAKLCLGTSRLAD